MSAELGHSGLYLPRVSVIVPIYNGEQDLPGLIECLRAQSYPADRVEYLLVDNGSCDRTPELLAVARDRFAQQGLTLRILQESQIQSAYAARNRGILAATGEFLAFTDADCYPEPGWLIELMQPFADPAVGLVAGEILALPGSTLLERYAERKGMLRQQDTLAHGFCPYGQTANLGIRRLALAAVGLFRPYLTSGGDADICWRIQQVGKVRPEKRPLKGAPAPSDWQSSWQITYAAGAIIRHRHRQTLTALYSQWYRYGTSNRYLHELHGVALAQPLPWQERLRQWLRWGLKRLPEAVVGWLTGQAEAVDTLLIPLDIYCDRARDRGQREACLPPNAIEITYLPPRPVAEVTGIE